MSAAWSESGPDLVAETGQLNRIGIGERYERDAEAFLAAQGLTPVERNWRCRLGEIDLVMRDGETLVFVEVRKRESQRFGGAAGSIGQHKRLRLERAIALYLSTLSRTPPCRVDAVLFGSSQSPVWLQNIFGD